MANFLIGHFFKLLLSDFVNILKIFELPNQINIFEDFPIIEILSLEV